MDFSKQDKQYMRKAFSLAKKGVGCVFPNPLVGAVVVKDNKILAQGFHKGYRKPHAEAEALGKIGNVAIGATIYVSLEPCCHFGSNPPCTDLIIKAGIKRVVFSNKDPNPIVSKGHSVQQLQEAGITVDYGLLEEEGKQLNEVFFKYITQNKPFVTLKLAQTLDGKIADRFGDSKWISGALSMQEVHRQRYAHESIMVGSGTILKDDPQLTIRLPHKTKSYTKIVIDKHLETPPQARIFDSKDPVIIVTQTKFRNEASKYKYAEFVFLEINNNEFDLAELFAKLGEKKITSVFVEGGSKLAYSLMRQDCVDKLLIFYAPVLALDNGAVSGFNGDFPMSIADFKRFKLLETKVFDEDVLLTYSLQAARQIL